MDKSKIVIADDHELLRKGIRSVLEDCPEFSLVGEAVDGPSLFAILNETFPDCVLVDITMPEFEPISAIRKIRDNYPKMKILIVTAHDDDVYFKGLLSAGADGYHLKGGSLADLRLAINRVLRGEQWLSSTLVKKLINNSVRNSDETVLTHKQQELLKLLQQGLDNKAIASRLDKSVKTIENNLTRLYQTLNVQSRLEAVNFANQTNPLKMAEYNEFSRRPDNSFKSALLTPINVLLVDDNAHYRHEFQHSINLAYPKSEVYASSSISEAISMLPGAFIRLAFVDMILDKESGIDCTRKIKQASPDTRVILMSAYPDREFHRLGIEAGALAFVDKKDLDIATLRQIITDAVQ